jgi:hypothetical protein
MDGPQCDKQSCRGHLSTFEHHSVIFTIITKSGKAQAQHGWDMHEYFIIVNGLSYETYLGTQNYSLSILGRLNFRNSC